MRVGLRCLRVVGVGRLALALTVAQVGSGILGALPTGKFLRLPRLSRPFRPALAAAQTPVRIRAMGDPRPGDQAPAFSLPYFTTEGPGPVDQPFTLRAELGRVVVLAFCRGLTDSTAVVLLRTLTARYDSLFPGEVAVAGVVPEHGAALIEGSRANSLRIKLLADTTEQVRRLFGVERNQNAVYVIGPTGRVTWRDLRFNPLLASGYDRLGQEVAAGAGKSGFR